MSPLKRLFGRVLGNRFVRDAATLQVASLLNQGSQLLSTILIAYLLGAHGQGLFSIAVALQGFTWFLVNVGVGPATVSQIGAAAARDMEHKTAAWIAFLVKAILILALVIVVVGWLFLPRLAWELYDDRSVGVWAWWLCFQPIVELPKIVVGVAFQGTRRMLALGQLENAHELVRLFLVVLGAILTGSAEGAVLGHLAAAGFGSAIGLSLYQRARADGGHPLPSPREVLRWLPEVPLRKGIRLGFRVGLVKNAHVMVMDVLPRLIIGGMASPEYTAYFHIAHRIIGIPTMVMQGVSRVAVPALGGLAGLQDVARFRRLFLRVSFTTGALITSGVLIFLPLIPFAVERFFPEGYRDPVFTFAKILAIGRILFSFGAALEGFYMAANKVRLWLWLSLAGSFVTVPINVWLIVHVPIWGTAWGITVYQSWLLVHYACVGWVLFKTRHQSTFETAPSG